MLVINEPQKRLMHQRRRLERLPWLLLGQPSCCQLPQLVVDQRQELLSGLGVARVNTIKNVGHIGHDPNCRRCRICPQSTEVQQRMRVSPLTISVSDRWGTS